MDTALGLALTPTTVAWVLADRQGGQGKTVAWDEFTVPRHDGPGGAVSLAAHAAATVSRIRAFVLAEQGRLRGVGVTWDKGVAVEAALLLEALTARFDSVLPIRNNDSTNPGAPVSQLQLARRAALRVEPAPAPEFSASADTRHESGDPVRVGALAALATGTVGLVVLSALVSALRVIPAGDTSPPVSSTSGAGEGVAAESRSGGQADPERTSKKAGHDS